MANAPQLAEPVQPDKKPTTIQDLLSHPKTVDKFKQIVPRHLSAERMLRVMAQAVFKTPKLAECHPMSLLGAMMACASLGLEPNTPLGHCYLIPFEKRKYNSTTRKWDTERVDVQLIIGYKGYIDLARRSGTLSSIHADVVYEGDDFSFEYGSNMHLKHVPKGSREKRKPIWAYAHAKLTDGEAFEVLPWAEVERIRNGTQAYQAALAAKADADGDDKKKWRLKAYTESPWVKYEHEMGAKSMVRRLTKWLSLSIEFANAAALDAMSEVGKTNFGLLPSADAAGFDPTLALEASGEVPMDTTMGGGEEGEPEPVGNSEQANTAKPAAAEADGGKGGKKAAAKAGQTNPPAETKPPTESTTAATAGNSELFGSGD